MMVYYDCYLTHDSEYDFFSNGNKDSLATWCNKQSTSLIIRTAWEVLNFSYGKGPFLRPISQMEINLVFYEFLSKQ